MKRFVYLDTGEIFEADADGFPVEGAAPFCTFASTEDAIGPVFAAALELLEALELAKAELARTTSYPNDALEAVCAAIAKATGGAL